MAMPVAAYRVVARVWTYLVAVGIVTSEWLIRVGKSVCAVSLRNPLVPECLCEPVAPRLPNRCRGRVAASVVALRHGSRQPTRRSRIRSASDGSSRKARSCERLPEVRDAMRVVVALMAEQQNDRRHVADRAGAVDDKGDESCAAVLADRDGREDKGERADQDAEPVQADQQKV
jgi:hypothetical protein